MEVKDVEIQQSHTTTVEIPSPGLITFLSRRPGAGSLYKLNEYGDQIWVLNLLENSTDQVFYLQPGSYRVIFRRGDFRSTAQSIVRDFVVSEGSPETIKLYGDDR